MGRPSEEENEHKFTQILLSPTNTDLGTVVDGLDVKISQLMLSNQNKVG